MRLFLFEFKKMTGSRGMLLLILLLMVINFAKISIFVHYNPMLGVSRTNSKDQTVRLYQKKYEGKITEKSARKVIEGYEACERFMQGTGEYNEEDEFCFQIYPLYKYQYTYHMVLQDRLDDASENTKFYQSKSNFYEAERNELIRKIYFGREIDSYYDSEDFYYLFAYHFSTLLLVLFALILSYQFFYMEKENGMYQMLISLGKNRRTVFTKKYLNLIFGIFLVGTVLYLQDYILFGNLLHLRGILNPVYAIQSYSDSPFDMTILQYYLLICGIRMGIVLLISLVFVFVEQWFSGKILPVAAGGVVAVAVVLTGDHYFNLESYGMKLHVISLWNHPCPAGFVWLAVYGILLVILSVLVYRSFRIHN